MTAGGNFAPPFAEPDALVQTMRQRMDALINGAMLKGSAYFRQRMILDTPNLVNESLTSQTMTVLESLRNIDSYLARLARRFTASTTDITIVPSLIDTRSKLAKVIRSYDKITEVQRLYETALRDQNQVLDEAKTKELADATAKAYESVIEAAYNEFNVLLQRDSFLMGRISTFVRYDYADRIRRKENMSEYQKQLFVVTGKNLLDKLVEVNQVNPQGTELDLNQAQVINIRNLEAVEALTKDSLMEMISSMNAKIGGRVLKPKGWPTPDSILSAPLFWFATDSDVIRGAWDYLKFMNAHPMRDKDDEYQSIAQFRAKLCVQSLAFYDTWKFEPLCRGTSLTSRYTNSQDVKLSTSYDEVRAKRYANSGSNKGDPGARSEGVCALRNYIRRNQAYWMTKSFSAQSTGSAPLTTPASPSSVVP